MEEREIYRAKILSEAVPYLQEYNGKTVVVKYGGNAMINEELMNNVISDICLMTLVGINVVLVHGGGPEINKALKRSGIESKFIDGLRYTDEETIDIDRCNKTFDNFYELHNHLINEMRMLKTAGKHYPSCMGI